MPLLLFIHAILSNVWANPHLPKPLTEWVDWILEEHPEVQCIDHDQHNCTWQGSLQMHLAVDEMQFTQMGQLDADGWVQLPGDSTLWPINIQVNNQHLPVLERDGVPKVYVQAGAFVITGTISWNTIPYQLQVPPQSGVIQILQDQQWRTTTAEQNGIVILSAKTTDPNSQPPVVQVSRLWTDANPPTLLTQLSIQNIGTLQQVSLGNIVNDQMPLIEIATQLPYWFDKEELWISVPTGTHQLSLLNTTAIQVTELNIPEPSNIWPEVEYWAIEHAPDLRQVRVQGLTPVSFEQTHLPEEWAHMAVYRKTSANGPTIEEIHRADPTPPRNTLELTRTVWPNLHSNGFWLKDHISGKLQRPQVIQSNDKNIVQLKQQGQIQTIFEKNDEQHISLKHRDVNVVTHAQTNNSTLSIHDWAVDFDAVTIRLQMPQEWKVLYWNGWIWTPYTILILTNLLFALGVGWRNTDTLLHKGVYGLGILAGCLFAPKATLLFQIFQIGSLLFVPLRSLMLIASIAWIGMAIYESRPDINNDLLVSGEHFYAEREMLPMKKSRDYYTQKDNHNFGIQLGMGLPTWQGQEVVKTWRNVDTQSQPMNLGVLRSTEQRFLALVAAICLVFGAWRRSISAHLIILIGFCTLASSPAYAEESKSTVDTSVADDSIGLSEADKQLILQTNFPDNCKAVDGCIDISLSSIVINESSQEMTIWMEVHAIEDAILILPGPLSQWNPHTITLEEQPLLGIRRNANGYLEAKIPKGVWSLEIVGTIDDSINLDWPTKPHTVHVTSNNRAIQGINSTGQLNGVLTITDVTSKLDTTSIQLRPNMTWKRHLVLGSTWRIHHTLQVDHSSDSKTIQLPLLPGERPESNSITTEKDHWLIPVQNQSQTISWISQIPTSQSISLDFPAELLETMALGMEWSLDCQSQYLCQPKGLAPIQHVQSSGEGIPTWVPYPEESLDITIQSLKPSDGEHLQISKTNLTLDDQLDTLFYALHLTLESSQASEVPIQLPDNSEILEYSVNGERRHFKQASQLTIFSDIGEQEVFLKWSLSKNNLDSTLPMPSIQGLLSNPKIQYTSQHQHVLWARSLWENSLPNSILWAIITGLMALSLARHPSNRLSFQTWLLALVGAGHTNAWLWIPLLLMLIFRHFSQKPFVSVISGVVALGLLIISPLSILLRHRSLWIWNRSDLQWYTDVTDTIPSLTIIAIPSWILTGLWAVWWCWMVWMLGAPLFREGSTMVNKLRRNVEPH